MCPSDSLDLDDEDRDLTLESTIKNIHMFAAFLLTINEVTEEETLYVRDALFELLTPEDDCVPVLVKATPSKDN